MRDSLCSAHTGNTEHLGVMSRLVPALHEEGLLTDDLTTPGRYPQFGQKTVARSSTPSIVQAENSIAYMGVCLVEGIHRRIDLRCYPEHQEACALLHFTGSGQLNRFMSRAANERGYTLSELGLQPSRKAGPAERVPCGEHIELFSEEEIFERLQLAYVEPWERKDKMDVLDATTGRPYFQTKQSRAAAPALQALAGPSSSALPALRQ